MTTTRRAAVLGGNRIPFARQFGPYAEASNQDMLTAALEGLVARHGLAGERLGEVVAGAVIKHSRDFNLTREAVLGSSLSPATPAYDVQQACGTGLEATILVANKIALGQADSGIAGGVDSASDAPVVVPEKLRRKLLRLNRAKTPADRAKAAIALRPTDLGIQVPAATEPRTGMSMGEHMAVTTARWGITREAQDELALASHQKLAAAYEAGFFDDLMTPYLGLTRDQNLRPDSTLEKLASLRTAFGTRPGRDDDGGQLDAAQRRRLHRAPRLRGVGRGARAEAPGLPRRRRDRRGRLPDRRGGPAHGPGLRRAPDAGAAGPDPPGLRPLRDPRGVRGDRPERR